MALRPPPAGIEQDRDIEAALHFLASVSCDAPAFWRRIKYMIETPSPSESDFKFIFQTICSKKNVGFDEDAYAYMVEKYYKQAGREFRSVHPRDILNRISDFISYFGLPPKLSRQVVDQACNSFFGNQAAQTAAAPAARLAS